MPGRAIQGSISFINPEVNPATCINIIRINISNNDHTLKPGMPVYVIIKQPQRKTLALPTDAVLRSENMAMVWVETGPNTFTSKMVTTGEEGNGAIEIKSGLQPGDVVVMNGAYLLQSEYIFRKGSNSMGSMGNMKM
jgi:Cu(I)/Ag(I) efflux system membrane fusion protein